MANVKRNARYTVVAYNANGGIILSERATTKVRADKTAREFLTYANVYTVDVERNGDAIHATRYVKLTPCNGIVIANGTTKNIRF